MKFKFNLFLILLLYSFNAFAQNKVGNGGDVVTCNNKSPELLDFYENPSDLLQTSLSSYQEIILNRLNTLEKISLKLATQYKQRYTNIENEIDFKENISLSDIKDSAHLFLPKSSDCRLQQIAIRKSISTSKEKLFIFDQQLWKKLNALNKAGLIFHEIIYEHLIKLGDVDSTKARKINNYLFNKNLNKADFWKLIRELKVPIYPD